MKIRRDKIKGSQMDRVKVALKLRVVNKWKG